jgi:hypothetical protein
MKKHLCDICGSEFKSEEGVEQHKKRNPLIESDYHNSVLKNKNKYFIFYDSHKISRNHDNLYHADTLRIDCFLGNQLGNIIKKSRVEFPSKRIENEFSELGEDECLKLSQYLRNLNFPDSQN